MVADHHQLEHAAAGDAGDHDHEHGDPHAWFGHLLGHLPAAFSALARLSLAATVEPELPELAALSPVFLPDPPLRPPLKLLS